MCVTGIFLVFGDIGVQLGKCSTYRKILKNITKVISEFHHVSKQKNVNSS
jgi:hypothetical protein